MTTRAAVALASLLIVFAGCGVPDPKLATPLPASADPKGEILFVANGDVYRWDGDVAKIVADGQARSPAWNSDGQRIAYVRMSPEGYSDLVVADRSGREVQQMTTHRPDEEPWSRRFAHYAYWAIDPDWSPTKPDQLVYGSDKGGVEYVYSDDPNDPGRLSDPIFLWLVERDGLDPAMKGLVEGIEATEAFLDALDAGSLNPEQGKSGVSKIVQANDHFLLALHMSMARTQNLQEFAINNGLPIGEQAELGAEDQPEEVMVEDS